MKRKILSLILVFAMTVSLLTVGTGAVEPTYGDTAGHWAESSIERWSGHGIIQGSNGLFDPNGQLTCAQLATILAKLLKLPAAKDAGFTDNTADAWYYDAINRCAAAGILNGNGDGTVTPEAPITRERAMVMLARALGIEPIRKPDLTKYTDAAQVSAYAQGYVAALIEAGIVGGVTADELAPQDNITRAEFAQIFHNIIGTYIVSKGTYDKDIKGSVLIRTDDVTFKNMTVDGDLIIGCGAADGKITLDNVTVKGRLLVWGGGTKAVYCNAGTNMPAVVVARVDDAVKVIYDRDSTLAVIDTIKVRITERAKQHKETEVIFYDVSGLREAQKQLNAIVADNQIALTAPAHLYALVGESSVKAEFTNNSKNDTYKIEICRSKDGSLIADAFELAAGKSISTLTLLEAPEFGNTDCIVMVTAYRDGKQIGTLNTELTLHTAYLWPKEVQ